MEEEEEGSGGGRGGLKKIFFERQCSLKVPEHGELFATYFVPFLKGLLKVFPLFSFFPYFFFFLSLFFFFSFSLLFFFLILASLQRDQR